MNLKELKKAIDSSIKHLETHQTQSDIKVLITLSEASMGARASCGIGFAGMGIDWEREQFRIEPITNLVRKGKALNDVLPVAQKEFGGVKYYSCQGCMLKVSKDDCYCRHCRQKLR